jgi:hypothetical protein
MLILHDCPHVHDGIVGVHLAIGRLPHARELKLVSENQATILSDIIRLESFANLESGGAKSLIQNPHESFGFALPKSRYKA